MVHDITEEEEFLVLACDGNDILVTHSLLAN